MIEGGIGWVAAVNLIIWTGLFLYLLRLRNRVQALEREPGGAPARDRAAAPAPKEARP